MKPHTMSGKHTPDEMAPGGLKRMAEVWHPDLPIQINWTWELDDGINANIFCPGNAQRWKMARIEAGSRSAAEAYARLIASAPELFEALQRLVNDSMFKDHPEASEMAIAALRKASGEG